eukprot:GHUV01008009.1.p1 GENE.GHUV01008009.1~~GHUV01008009.1.p1  ORF type:complete len:300 (+),score=122.17 GHUV01008009.1:305-1204(+)
MGRPGSSPGVLGWLAAASSSELVAQPSIYSLLQHLNTAEPRLFRPVYHEMSESVGAEPPPSESLGTVHQQDWKEVAGQGPGKQTSINPSTGLSAAASHEEGLRDAEAAAEGSHGTVDYTYAAAAAAGNVSKKDGQTGAAIAAAAGVFCNNDPAAAATAAVACSQDRGDATDAVATAAAAVSPLGTDSPTDSRAATPAMFVMDMDNPMAEAAAAVVSCLGIDGPTDTTAATAAVFVMDIGDPTDAAPALGQGTDDPMVVSQTSSHNINPGEFFSDYVYEANSNRQLYTRTSGRQEDQQCV